MYFIGRSLHFNEGFDRRLVRFFQDRAVSNEVVKQYGRWGLQVFFLCRVFRNNRIMLRHISIFVGEVLWDTAIRFVYSELVVPP